MSPERAGKVSSLADVFVDRSEPYVGWEVEEPPDVLVDKSEPCIGW